MKASLLPEAFPVGTLFVIVDGVPVTESPDGEVLGWDGPVPRRMPAGVARLETAVSEATFRTLVTELTG